MVARARIIFADVGQGDCTILIDPQSRRAMVVDCPTKNVDKVHQYLLAEGLVLSTLVVTHWDRDHYGGVARLAKAHLPSAVHYNNDTLLPDGGRGTKGIRSTLKAFLDLPWQSLKRADDTQSGQLGEMQWRLLAPQHAELTAAMATGQRNVASCVVDVRAEDTRILIGGDAVSSTWERLLEDGLGKADILRWPHHGAELHGDVDNGTASRLIADTCPSRIVVSVGHPNSYGHPAESVVRLARAGSQLACTQHTPHCSSVAPNDHSLCGASVLIDVDGLGYRVSRKVL